MKKLFAFITAAILAAATAQAAEPMTLQREMECYPTKVFVDAITQKYGEAPVFVGRNAGDSVTYVVAANEDKQTFTIALMTPNLTCIVAVGTKWELPTRGRPL